MDSSQISTIIGQLGAPLAVLLALALLATHLLVKWAEQRVSSAGTLAVTKAVEHEKHALNLALEANRLELQRRLHDFTLFAERRRLWYEKIYEALLRAEGAAANVGAGHALDLTKAQLGEALQALAKHKFPQADIHVVTSNWGDDPDAAREKFNSLIQEARISKAKRLLRAAKNESLLGELYLSDDVRIAAADALKQIWNVMGHWLQPAAYEGVNLGESNSKATNAVIKLRHLMQKDLARGDYEAVNDASSFDGSGVLGSEVAGRGPFPNDG